MGVLLKAIIDETLPLSEESQRFASILQFVADECDSGIFYLFKDWTVRAAVGESTLDFHPERPRIVYLSKNDYPIDKSWEKQDGRLSVHIPKDELVFSTSGTVCKGALEQQGLNATTALLTLAAAGVDIALPSFFLRRSDDEIKSIREKLEEDRVVYLGAISQLAIEAFDCKQALPRLKVRDLHLSSSNGRWNLWECGSALDLSEPRGVRQASAGKEGMNRVQNKREESHYDVKVPW